MSNRTIYEVLCIEGLTPEGACALMGNMQAESGMKANIAQRGMTKLSDEDYTALADNGIPMDGKDFANDSVGYGLCQWTYRPRKAALLAYCKAHGVSVGDEKAQVEFCLQELQREYPMLLLELKTSNDLYQCTADVCTKYERPAVNNIDARYRFAQQFYNEFAGSGALADEHKNIAPAKSDAGVKAAVMVLQLLMNYAGYCGAVTGERSAEFFNALDTFVQDLKKM